MKILSLDPAFFNLGICLIEGRKLENTLKYDILYWDVIDLNSESNLSNKNTFKNLSYEKLSKMTYKVLNNLYEQKKSIFENIDYIFIEDQQKSSKKIKFISDLLFAYLIILNPFSKIHFMQGKYKLKTYTGPVKWGKEPKTQYAKNKFLAKKYTEIFLQEKFNYIWLNFFLNEKKRDDLADSFLMCIYQLQNK